MNPGNDLPAGASSPAGPTWTVLVATIGERRDLFGRLLDVLLPQTVPYAGRVRVLAYWSNGDPALPEIRQRMVDAVDTDYLCCVDDDDLVPGYYVAEVMAAVESRPDYVGFDVQCYTDGLPTALAHHSLRYAGWYGDGYELYRDISHLNPIRTDLARLADFRRIRPRQPEDRGWVQQLRDSRRLRSEVVIDKVMYHYLHVPVRSAGIGSRWRVPDRIRRQGFEPLPVDHPYFSYHPGSFVG